MDWHDADRVARAARVMGSAAAANAKVAAMQAANQERAARGEPLAYDEKAFLDVIEEHGLHWNYLVEELR